MPAKLIPDKKVEMLLRAGKRPKEIVEILLKQDHIVVGPEAISMWRKRRGIEPWVPRHDDLIPWKVLKEHAQRYPAKMLRAESRRRAGMPVSPDIEAELERWISTRQETRTVVTYDRTTGWDYVPRRKKDLDLIRDPRVK